MLIAAMLLAVQDGPPVPYGLDQQQYEACLAKAKRDPDKAVIDAAQWMVQGGGYLAQQCLGMAYAGQQRWSDAAGAFERAATDAQHAKDKQAADFWAQAGNAWGLAGNYEKAEVALNSAIGSGDLDGLALGEAYLDRGRMKVASGDNAGARDDIDSALKYAEKDPLAWLLSATLARRMGNLPLAREHIDHALKLASDDASVQLEAGNIAALEKNEAGAKQAWTAAKNLAPTSPVGIAAANALKQFAGDKSTD